MSYLQAKRDGTAAAKRFFKRLTTLAWHGEPRKIVTDKLRSYGSSAAGDDARRDPQHSATV